MILGLDLSLILLVLGKLTMTAILHGLSQVLQSLIRLVAEFLLLCDALKVLLSTRSDLVVLVDHQLRDILVQILRDCLVELLFKRLNEHFFYIAIIIIIIHLQLLVSLSIDLLSQI